MRIMLDKYKFITEVVEETEDYKESKKKIDEMMANALKRHYDNHGFFFGYPCGQDYKEIFHLLIDKGICNSKTFTFHTPLGSITYAPKVNAPKD